MKRIVWILNVVFLLNVALAIPPIAQEFYGVALLSGSPAPMMTGVNVYYNNGGNNTLCGTFQISEPGKYGLLTCMGDDPETPEIEGAIENENITFKMTTYNASTINGTNWSGNMSDLIFTPITLDAIAFGDTSWKSGEFHQVNLNANFDMWWLTMQNITNVTNVTIPPGFCGDAICGLGEDCGNCVLDCGTCPPPPPGKGGGGGAKGQSSGAKQSTSVPKQGTPEQLICIENWQCSEYSNCQPNEQKIRTCEDTSKCGTDRNKPKTSESCCYEEWKCSDWNECSVFGEQTRTCTDTKTCNTTDYKPNTTQTCQYPTCNDGIKNGLEDGVDCGGPCQACKGIEYAKPVAERPTGIARCGDNICNIGEPCGCPQDCRKFPWFIIVIAIVMSLIEDTYSKRRAKRIRDDIYVKKIERLKKVAKIKRDSMWFKTIVMIASLILAFYIHYFATCPGEFRRYLAVLIAGAITTPIIAYFILKRFEYSEEEKELRYELLIETHKEQLERLIVYENVEIVKVEKKIIDEIKTMDMTKIAGVDDAMKAQLKMKLDSIAYKLGLLSRFLKENEDFIDVESQMCDEIEALREDENYKKMSESTYFKPIDSSLGILLAHHKDKAELLRNKRKDEERERDEERRINEEKRIAQERNQDKNGDKNVKTDNTDVKSSIIAAKEEIKDAKMNGEINNKINDSTESDDAKKERTEEKIQEKEILNR